MIMARWESFLGKLALELLILAGLGPLVGRANLAQTILLALLVAAVLYLLGDLLLLPRLLPSIGHGWAAVADGLIAALLLRVLAPMLGAAFGWGGCLLLGAAVGISEFFIHHWEGVRVEGR